MGLSFKEGKMDKFFVVCNRSCPGHEHEDYKSAREDFRDMERTNSFCGKEWDDDETNPIIVGPGLN